MKVLPALTALWLGLAAPHVAAAENDWFVALLGGQYTGNQLREIPVWLDLEDSYTLGLSVSKQFAEWGTHLRWEGELQGLKHFGEQDHVEFVASINLRWVTFPWNRFMTTTVAAGGGLSVATEVPELERRDASDATALLHYILLEITFAVPDSRWSVVTRIHHRSGAFGLFSHSGSNVLAVGLRYRF